MRTIHNYTTESETFEAQCGAGRYNPATELTYRDKTGKHTVTIGAGTSDDLHLFRDGDHTYLLTINNRLDYVGVEVYSGSDMVGDMFLQADHEVESVLGRNGLDKSPMWIVKTMANHIY